ncbi:hypothetical protein NSQ26_08330 [Bacillus sp. FSL W7-1360]
MIISSSALMTRTMRFILMTILILAVIGIATNILGFVQHIIFIAGICAVMYIVYRLIVSQQQKTSLFPKKKPGPTRAQIKKAQRTSTVKPNQQQSKRQIARKSKLARRDQPHLTVIEGKKSNKTRKWKA